MWERVRACSRTRTTRGATPKHRPLVVSALSGRADLLAFPQADIYEAFSGPCGRVLVSCSTAPFPGGGASPLQVGGWPQPRPQP